MLDAGTSGRMLCVCERAQALALLILLRGKEATTVYAGNRIISEGSPTSGPGPEVCSSRSASLSARARVRARVRVRVSEGEGERVGGCGGEAEQRWRSCLG